MREELGRKGAVAEDAGGPRSIRSEQQSDFSVERTETAGTGGGKMRKPLLWPKNPQHGQGGGGQIRAISGATRT